MKKVKLQKIGEFVKLNQGLAINSKSKKLISKIYSDIFCYPLLKISSMISNDYEIFVSKDVNKSTISEEKDIIYTRTGKIGLAFKGFNGVVHNNSFLVKSIDNRLKDEYLYLILNTSFVQNQAINMSKSSVQPDLTHSMFRDIKIPIHNLKDQDNIVNIISKINRKIDLNNKINDNLVNLQ